MNASNAGRLPLGAGISPKIFKTVFLDIGLMQHICSIPPTSVFEQKSLLDIYRGSLAEQFVGQELLLQGGSENDKLYHWERLKKSSTAEVDFLMVRDGKIYPLEVKSATAGKLKSIILFLNEHPHCKEGIVLNMGNISINRKYKLKFMPLYTRLN